MDYKQKYIKYKNKYLELKNQYGGDRCPFKVGDRVMIISDKVGDPYYGKHGIITHLHFVSKNIGGQDVNICTGAIIDFGDGTPPKRYMTTNLLNTSSNNQAVINNTLEKLSIEDLYRLYYRMDTSERYIIENFPFDFYDQPIPINIEF
jgi:hypothetical protein